MKVLNTNMEEKEGWFDTDRYYFNKLIKENFDIFKKDCDFLLENNLFAICPQSSEFTEDRKGRGVLANKWNMFKIKHDPNSINYIPNTVKFFLKFDEIMNCRIGTIIFSMVPAQSKIRLHTGPYKPNKRTRHQLCIYNEDSDNTFIQVNGHRRTFKQGETISFDDGYMHGVENNSNEPRIVLLYDSIPF